MGVPLKISELLVPNQSLQKYLTLILREIKVINDDENWVNRKKMHIHT